MLVVELGGRVMSARIHLSRRPCHRANLFSLCVLFAQREIVATAFSVVDCEVASVRRLISKTQSGVMHYANKLRMKKF